MLGLPMGEYEVKYEFNGSAINFINGKCNSDNGRSPAITSITDRLVANKEANDDYLRLPPSTSAAEKSEKSEEQTKWDFSGPPMDLMSFIEFPTPHERPPPKPSVRSSQRKAVNYEDDTFWDNLSEEQLQQLDDDVNKVIAQKLHSTSAAKEPLLPIDTPIEDVERNSTRDEMTAVAVTCGLKSAPSTSRTPAYQPLPRRPALVGHALQSPYIDYGRKDNLKCKKIASRAYDVVCSATGWSTRTSSQSSSETDDIIISFPDYYVSLRHLSESVKPGDKLVNTVAEIGIYALNDRKAKIPVKQILPLRVASFLQDGILDIGEVNSAFQRSLRHLDHAQLVMYREATNTNHSMQDMQREAR